MVSAKALAIASVGLLAACASAPEEPYYWRERDVSLLSSMIDYRSRLADWPELEVHVHTVPPHVAEVMCSGADLPPGYRQLGCAVPHFCQRRCTIWIADYRLPKEKAEQIIQHERAHCRGYDHPGASVMRDGWERAKARGCGPDMPSRSF